MARESRRRALNVSIVHARGRQVKMTIRQEMNESDSGKVEELFHRKAVQKRVERPNCTVRLLKKGRRHICRRPICLRLNDAPGEGTGDFVAKRHDEGRSSRGTVVWALRDVDELGVHVIRLASVLLLPVHA